MYIRSGSNSLAISHDHISTSLILQQWAQVFDQLMEKEDGSACFQTGWTFYVSEPVEECKPLRDTFQREYNKRKFSQWAKLWAMYFVIYLVKKWSEVKYTWTCRQLWVAWLTGKSWRGRCEDCTQGSLTCWYVYMEIDNIWEDFCIIHQSLSNIEEILSN